MTTILIGPIEFRRKQLDGESIREVTLEKSDVGESSAVALAVASTNLRHKEIIEASPTYRNHTGQPKLCWCDMCAYVRGNVTEINATTLADAQAALARFKADAVREALWDEHCRQCPPCRGNLAVNGVGGCAPGRKLLAELERKP